MLATCGRSGGGGTKSDSGLLSEYRKLCAYLLMKQRSGNSRASGGEEMKDKMREKRRN